ncbi:hypothetical protein [Robiginitalea sp. SC105]|uniref:hypothetical protein n=1 Tax=Robiginitalea sp. SC105 TaxID=2762332 RepID=UPI00163A5FF1|nr:hypothetical protein [Robiginitalea sp. SC105]MBC2839611.1 hypothetical protein [Robiginitalea sp. SC105]
MIKTVLSSFLMLALMGTAFAQAPVQLRYDGSSATQNEFFNQLRNKKEINTGVLETVGTPYIEDDFKPCEIFFGDEKIGKFFYRHNALNDEIEIKDSQVAGEEVSSLATMRQLTLIDLENGNELSLMTYENKKDQMRNGYLYRLKDGDKYSLLFKKNVKFTQGTQPVNSLVRPTPNKFSLFIEYYYFTPDGKVAQYLPTRKNRFIRSFDKSLQDKLKEFIDEQDINLNQEEDLVRVFSFLNKQA